MSAGHRAIQETVRQYDLRVEAMRAEIQLLKNCILTSELKIVSLQEEIIEKVNGKKMLEKLL